MGRQDTAFRASPGTWRPHRRFRRLGHARPIRLADRRAPRRAPRRRRVRCLAHVRRRSQGRARAARFCSTCSRTMSRKLTRPGKALYSCMLNEAGGVHRRSHRLFPDRRPGSGSSSTPARGTRTSRGSGSTGTRVRCRRSPSGPIWRCSRCKGPKRARRRRTLLSAAGAAAALAAGDLSSVADIDGWFVARTGYTGEDGFEIMLPAGERRARVARAECRWVLPPAASGARDTLRLEAGMNLYGNDMDETTHPFESGLALDGRAGARRAALHRARSAASASGPRCGRAGWSGLVLEDRGVLRSHQKVIVTPGRGCWRDHQRHVLPDAGALDRARARARRRPAARAGGYPRQASQRARGEAAVRALRQDRLIRINGVVVDEQCSRRSAVHQDPRVGAHAARWHRRDRDHRSCPARARRSGVRRGARGRPYAASWASLRRRRVGESGLGCLCPVAGDVTRRQSAARRGAGGGQ